MSTQASKTAAILRKCMGVADKSPKIDRAKLVGTAAVQDIGVILAALEHNPEAAADANYQRGHEIGYREGQASMRRALAAPTAPAPTRKPDMAMVPKCPTQATPPAYFAPPSPHLKASHDRT